MKQQFFRVLEPGSLEDQFAVTAPLHAAGQDQGELGKRGLCVVDLTEAAADEGYCPQQPPTDRHDRHRSVSHGHSRLGVTRLGPTPRDSGTLGTAVWCGQRVR